MKLGTIVQGDALEVLQTWPDASVQCVVTSPPYWGLREYRVDGERLEGQWGSEKTLAEHIANLVALFREVRRVLRPDGVVFINYGDAYAANRPGGQVPDTSNKNRENMAGLVAKVPSGLKPKDLIGLPWRIALALQDDGWWLRCDIVWSKPNPMPESVTDRPARSHEYIFLLTKRARYFYDADAVREAHAEPWRATTQKESHGPKAREGAANMFKEQMHRQYNPAGHNLRSVWTIPVESYPGAHFATFPRKLVEPCIKAGTSERGACPACGAPWRREVERTFVKLANRRKTRKAHQGGGMADINSHEAMGFNDIKTTGWAPTCKCPPADPVPCVVLDPFAGSGTTLMVAYRLGREAVGIDLAGGDADLGGHTAHERIAAVRAGFGLDEFLGHQKHQQQNLLELTEPTP